MGRQNTLTKHFFSMPSFHKSFLIEVVRFVFSTHGIFLFILTLFQWGDPSANCSGSTHSHFIYITHVLVQDRYLGRKVTLAHSMS